MGPREGARVLPSKHEVPRGNPETRCPGSRVGSSYWVAGREGATRMMTASGGSTAARPPRGAIRLTVVLASAFALAAGAPTKASGVAAVPEERVLLGAQPVDRQAHVAHPDRPRGSRGWDLVRISH